MTIKEYLQGCVGFSVDDNAIATILVDRGIESDEEAEDLTKKQRDLCKADLYMWCASTPSIRGSVEDQNGNWKHKEGGTQSSAYDKRNLRKMAFDIYKSYGENASTSSSIKFHGSGMKLWQK